MDSANGTQSLNRESFAKLNPRLKESGRSDSRRTEAGVRGDDAGVEHRDESEAMDVSASDASDTDLRAR